MFSETGRTKLLVVTYAALFCLILRCCIAKDEHNTVEDCASSCGNINISYPFRLKTDPIHCGKNKYELACVSDAVILYFNVSGKEVRYRVQAINYNNFTIRLADPNVFMDNCTFPVRPSSNPFAYSIYKSRSVQSLRRHTHAAYQDLILASCPFPVTRKFVEFNSSCNKVPVINSHFGSNRKRYWYAYVGYNFSGFENSCRIEYKTWTSLLPEGTNNISFTDANNSLEYGFELYWESACCASEFSRKYNCSRAIKNYYCSGTLAEWIFGCTFFVSQWILTFYAMFKLALCFCGTPRAAIFLMYKWRRRHLSAYDNIEEFLRCNQNDLMPVRYSYSQVKKMTKGFKEKLGEGGYGSVYKGKLRSGSFAAIKILNKSKANGQDFINEVATIGRIHHTNVVQLIGFCVEGSKRALVYKFMVNGSLNKYAFSKEGCIPINIQQIYDICLGVAHGIKYLHQGCDMQILHFDIKPHNILLDENFIPKISDFGLAKLHPTDNSIVSLTAARGTIGYMAPELFYKNIGHVSYKADVYSFGMLLLEMVGRRNNLNVLTEHSSRNYFPLWIYDQIGAEKNVKLSDGPEEENKIVKKMIIVALWCIQLNPIDRPSMHKVIEMLEVDVEHLEMPPKPFVSPQEVHSSDAGLVTFSVDTSCNYSDTTSMLMKAD